MKEDIPGVVRDASDYDAEERAAIQEEQSSQAAQNNGKDQAKKDAQQDKKPRRKRKAKASGPNLVGWFLEAYPLKRGEDGKTSPQYPPTVFELTKSKNLKQAMEQYESVARSDPDKIANCYCRILQVHKDFRTQVRQVIEIV